jgi:hypothetical protein
MGGIEGFHKKAFCGLGIAGGIELEFQSMACGVNGPIEGHPRSSHPHGRLINTPGVRRAFEVRATPLIELWGIALYQR